MNALSGVMLMKLPELLRGCTRAVVSCSLSRGPALQEKVPPTQQRDLRDLCRCLGKGCKEKGALLFPASQPWYFRDFLSWQLHLTMLFISWQMDLFSMNHPDSFKHLAMVLVSSAPHAKSSLAEWGAAGRNPPWVSMEDPPRALPFACSRRAKFEPAKKPALVFPCKAFAQNGLLGRFREAWTACGIRAWLSCSTHGALETGPLKVLNLLPG